LGDPFPDTDSGSIFHFPHHYGIEDFKKFISISHTVTARFFCKTWWNDWCRQGNESTTFPGEIRQTSGLIRQSGLEFRITFDWFLALAEVCAVWTHKVKYVDLYSASSRSASNALPLPVSVADLRKPTRQPGTSEHCETTWYGLVYHAICLFTPPATPGTHSAWAGSGWVGLGAWFRALVVYPSKDGHPPGH